MTKQFFNNRQAAEYLGYSRRTISRLAEGDNLKRVRIGRKDFFLKDDLDEFLKKHPKESEILQNDHD